MSNRCIADAISVLEELYSSLDDAYWEASSVDAKDRFYSLISATNHEMSELGKLSIQDHDLTYELVSREFQMAVHKLGDLEEGLEDSVLRARTALRLAEALKSLRQLIN